MTRERRIRRSAAPVTQCRATAKNTGRRCGQSAIPGGTVCTYHGGSAPQVRLGAALRLAELVNPALAQLARELVNTNDGTPMSRLRALENILDRGGFPRGAVMGDADAHDLLMLRVQSIIDNRPAGASDDDRDHVDSADPSSDRPTPTNSDG